MSKEQKETEDKIIVVHGDEIEEYSSDDPTYFWLYGSGRMILSIIVLCFLVIVAMLLNKARAHLLVDMDNRFNELYANAEMYESETTNADETTKYESIIPDEIVKEAAKNNVTVEEQLETTYNSGFGKFLIGMTIITILATLLVRAQRC